MNESWWQLCLVLGWECYRSTVPDRHLYSLTLPEGLTCCHFLPGMVVGSLEFTSLQWGSLGVCNSAMGKPGAV